MSIFTKMKAWYESLDEEEQSTVKWVLALAVPLAIAVFVANLFLLPIVYPALAGAALGLALGIALLGVAALALQQIGPIVIKHLDDTPTIETSRGKQAAESHSFSPKERSVEGVDRALSSSHPAVQQEALEEEVGLDNSLK